MRIAVCVGASQASSPGPWLPWPLADDGARAVDAAVVLKPSRPAVRVVAVAAGPPEADLLLREALIRGADEAARIWESGMEDGDARSAAVALAAAACDLDASLVLCSDAPLARELARSLGTPLIGPALSLRAAPLAAVLGGETGPPGPEIVLDAPAVVLLAAGRDPLPRPSLADRIRSARAEILRLRVSLPSPE